MKTVFIFGAGASRQAGAPLMSDFIDKAEELYRIGQQGIMEASSAFSDVFKAISDLRAIHQKAYLNLDNFEILFGAIEMANLTGKLASRDKESIADLRESLITLIVKTLEYSIQFPVIDEQVVPPAPYDKFAQMLVEVKKKKHSEGKELEVSFLTFNYDLALDYTFYSMKGWGQFDYCLEGSKLKRSPLLKLHGSINWGVCEECDKIIPYDFMDLWWVREEKFRDLPPAIQFTLGTNISNKQHHGQPLKPTPVLVPPTWNKTDYHADLAHVWSRASKELEEAENIFVIGYSLPETDSFFRYLYALGSESETRIKRFWVFNPDPDGKVKERFDVLIGRGIENRYRFISGAHGTFENAIKQIRDELLKVF